MKNKIYIFCGGTINRVAPHFAICSPAYGKVGTEIYDHLSSQEYYDVIQMPTVMAFNGKNVGIDYIDVCKKSGVSRIESNEDLRKVVGYLKTQDDTRCIIMASAVADYIAKDAEFSDSDPYSNKLVDSKAADDKGYFKERFNSSLNLSLHMVCDDKIIDSIRSERKDIFLVSFKATSDVPFSETYQKGLSQLKRSSSNLVFANDIVRKENMVITPEEYPYVSENREDALENLCEMILSRLKLTFNRTKLIDGEKAFPLNLEDNNKIPENFIPVLEGLITHGAFKEFNKRTAGHFGCKVLREKYQRISSVRKVDHNNVLSEGMSKIFVSPDGEISVMGGKASVGEHTQQMVYDHLGDKVDSIVHFHCPPKEGFDKRIPIKSQRNFECGSNECSLNCVSGMEELMEGVWVVHLENHGPNIAFSYSADPVKILDFIKKNWDLSKKIAHQVEKLQEHVNY